MSGSAVSEAIESLGATASVDLKLSTEALEKLASFLSPDASAEDKKAWIEFLCRDSRVAAFLQQRMGGEVRKRAAAGFTAKLLQAGLESGGAAVVSAAQMRDIHRASRSLLSCLGAIHRLPTKTPRADLLSDLRLLSGWQLSASGFETSYRGDPFRRQMMVDLYREGVRAFGDAQLIRFIAGIVSQLWGTHVEERAVRKVLTAKKAQGLREAVARENANRKAEDIASIEAGRITQRMKSQPSEKARREMEMLQEQADQIRNTGKRFQRESDALQAALECLDYLNIEQATPVRRALLALLSEKIAE